MTEEIPVEKTPDEPKDGLAASTVVVSPPDEPKDATISPQDNSPDQPKGKEEEPQRNPNKSKNKLINDGSSGQSRPIRRINIPLPHFGRGSLLATTWKIAALAVGLSAISHPSQSVKDAETGDIQKGHKIYTDAAQAFVQDLPENVMTSARENARYLGHGYQEGQDIAHGVPSQYSTSIPPNPVADVSERVYEAVGKFSGRFAAAADNGFREGEKSANPDFDKTTALPNNKKTGFAIG